MLWDYNSGLVRITPFFKACDYSKVPNPLHPSSTKTTTDVMSNRPPQPRQSTPIQDSGRCRSQSPAVR